MADINVTNKNLAVAMLVSTENKVNAQVITALSRARGYCQQNVKYKWGSKTGRELDCSGLVARCYPLLYEGVEKQFEQLRDWLFHDLDRVHIEPGDIIFFAERNQPNRVSHVGIVEEVMANRVQMIHSSESRGGVVMDDLNVEKNHFRESYFANAVAKVRPFLFRRFLYHEIIRSVQDAC